MSLPGRIFNVKKLSEYLLYLRPVERTLLSVHEEAAFVLLQKF